VTAWTQERRPPRRNRWLIGGRLRAFVPEPPVHILAARAVQALSGHNDCTHADVLALVDELLELGHRAPVPASPSRDRAEASDRYSVLR
jgi:hypothetical protein